MPIFKNTLSKADQCMAVVLACVVIDLMGLSLTIPILANFARLVQGDAPGCPPAALDGIMNETVRLTMLASDECQKSVNEIKANTGVLSTAYAIASFISTLWMPVFSDKFGRRLAILVSIFGSLIGFLGQGLTCPVAETASVPCVGIPGGFYFLVFIRFLGGLFGGTATVASAFVVDLYPQKERGKQFAKIGISAISAFTLGPSIGGGLAQFGLRVPLFVATGFSLLAMVAAYIYVQNAEDLGLADRKKNDDLVKNEKDVNIVVDGVGEKKDEEKIENETFVAWKEIRVWIISAQTMFTTLSFNGVSSLMALLLLEPRLGVVTTEDSVEVQGRKVGLWVSAFVPALAVSQMVVLLSLYPQVEKKFGILTSGFIGTTIMAGALVLMPYLPSAAYLFITQVLLALGNGLSTNVSSTYLSKFAGKGNAAQILAWGTRADTVGNILGPFLTYFYLIDSIIPFWFCGIFAMCGSLMSFSLLCFKRHASHVAVDEKRGEERTSLIKARKEHATKMKELRELHESNREEEAVSLRGKIHPAFYRGLYGEYTEQMTILSEHLYQELRKKNHMYMLGSGVEQIRQNAVTAHKDLISKVINSIPAPNADTGDKEFLDGVSIFLSESGHEEWALNIPGMTPDALINLMKIPH